MPSSRPTLAARRPPLFIAAFLLLHAFDDDDIVPLDGVERHRVRIVVEAAGIAEMLDRLRRMEAIAMLLVDAVPHFPEDVAFGELCEVLGDEQIGVGAADILIAIGMSG